MSDLPDFSNHGYEIIEELGRNREGGRITWKAQQLATGDPVALKQFCFATAGSSWSGFNAYEREIMVLKGLHHPGIPSYLESFETNNGFCLVCEYKNAPSLATNRSFNPEEIKIIAVKVLEILVYLQNRIPPVLHRDIKPENILVDDELNVYLVDFGFAKIGSQEVVESSVFKGTPGFIPPEQVSKPTVASDLYSLGATLICLLTGRRSTQMKSLMSADEPYKIEFKQLLPNLNLWFVGWLDKMVKPKLKERFTNAEEALKALNNINLIRRIPTAILSHETLELKAKKLPEKLGKTIRINNPIPETLLEGHWSVAPHPSDPPHTPDSHAWISLTPKRFSKNKVRCRVTVDPSKLMGNRVYERELILHTNAVPKTHSVTLKVETPIFTKKTEKPPYGRIAAMLIFSATMAGALLAAIHKATDDPEFLAMVGSWTISLFLGGALAGAVVGSFASAVAGSRSKAWAVASAVVGAAAGILFGAGAGTLFGAGAVAGGVLGILAGVLFGAGAGNLFGAGTGAGGAAGAIAGAWFGAEAAAAAGAGDGSGALLVAAASAEVLFAATAGAGAAIAAGASAGAGADFVVSKFRQKGFSRVVIAASLLLTIGLGIALGIGAIIGFVNTLIILALIGCAIPLAQLIFYSPFRKAQLVAKHHQFENEQGLIQP